MSDPAADATLNKFFKEIGKQVKIGKSVLELLEPCLLGDHRNKKIFRNEQKGFIEHTIYETEHCNVCGTMIHTSCREVDGRFVVITNLTESEFVKSIREIINKLESGGAK